MFNCQIHSRLLSKLERYKQRREEQKGGEGGSQEGATAASGDALLWTARYAPQSAAEVRSALSLKHLKCLRLNVKRFKTFTFFHNLLTLNANLESPKLLPVQSVCDC
jgi:hypothetical protein